MARPKAFGNLNNTYTYNTIGETGHRGWQKPDRSASAIIILIIRQKRDSAAKLNITYTYLF